MIDERQQELASLYAFDLLEGTARVEFEALLSGNAELRQLVAELRETAGQLAHAAPAATPSPQLKRRILATIEGGRPAPAANVVALPRPSLLMTLFPWAIAAGFALCAVWTGAHYFSAKAQNDQLTQQQALAEVALKTAEIQLEMERMTSTRLVADLTTVKADADRQLAAARQAADASRAELASFKERAQRDSDLARLKIATLASMLNNSPQALAVAVWDPEKQQGVFTVDRLPANATDQRYELWVIDGVPVSAGVFAVGADGRAKVEFKPTKPIRNAAKFAVSREKNDGRSSHDAPGEVVMISQ